MDRHQILAKLRERIVAFAASRIQRDQAEDLAQEVMIVLEQKYAHVERLEELLPLSLQILRFKMGAARRKSYRHGEHGQLSIDELPLADQRPDPLDEFEKKEQIERLAAAMRQLGDRCRQILAAKLKGQSFAEIQKALGADSINTVYTWDFRCRKQLMELLGGGVESGTRSQERVQ